MRLNGMPNVEGGAFPWLFPTGSGTYPRNTHMRFCDHRHHLLHFFSGQFKRDAQWKAWAAVTEARILKEVRDEELAKLRARKAEQAPQASSDGAPA